MQGKAKVYTRSMTTLDNVITYRTLQGLGIPRWALEIYTVNNSQRIEKATRTLVGKELTAEQIIFATKKTFPGLSNGIYVSDCAFTADSKGVIVPRTNTQLNPADSNDGVLLALPNGKYRVLSDKEIVRKAKVGRGRKANVPTPTAVLDKELAELGFKVE
jgi:hypothetical protein